MPAIHAEQHLAMARELAVQACRSDAKVAVTEGAVQLDHRRDLADAEWRLKQMGFVGGRFDPLLEHPHAVEGREIVTQLRLAQRELNELPTHQAKSRGELKAEIDSLTERLTCLGFADPRDPNLHGPMAQ